MSKKIEAVDCRVIAGDLMVAISQSTADMALDAIKALTIQGRYRNLMADDASFASASIEELEMAVKAKGSNQ